MIKKKHIALTVGLAVTATSVGLAMGLASARATSAPVAAVAAASGAAAPAYTLDKTHSSMFFTIRHAGVANFHARFNDIDGTINWDADNPADSAITIRIDAASVDTGNDRRDGHLRSPDFFNAAEFPAITFTSDSIERSGDAYKVHGELDMHGVKRPLTIDLRQTGSAQHRSGRELIGFESIFTIKRSEWDMNYGIDGGALGDDVRLTISLEALATE